MRDTLGKPEIIRYDEGAQSEYNQLKKRRAELENERNIIAREISQVLENIGVFEAERCDTGELLSQLSELRSQLEGKELGIHRVSGEVAKLERVHIWLKG